MSPTTGPNNRRPARAIAPVRPGQRAADKRYRVRLNRGQTAYVAAGPATAHVRALLDLDWPITTIATAAGVHPLTATRLAAGATTRTRVEVHDALLALPALAVANPRTRPTIGVVRRTRALAAVGWTRSHLARTAGTTCEALLAATRGRTMPVDLWQAIADAYDLLAAIPGGGPSQPARDTAEARRWPAPLDWPDDQLDEPAGQPTPPDHRRGAVDVVAVMRALSGDRVVYAAMSNRERVHCYAAAATAGWSPQLTADRLGVDRLTADRGLCRARARHNERASTTTGPAGDTVPATTTTTTTGDNPMHTPRYPTPTVPAAGTRTAAQVTA